MGEGRRTHPALARSGIHAEYWPEPLPGEATIIASAPGAREPGGPATLPIAHYAGEQVLLGFEAQLRSFGHMMRQHGRPVAFTPLPEIFATPRSLAALIPERASPDSAPEILHLRFGPARSARVLKGSRNMMVLADDPVRLPIDDAIHPLGTGTCLPSPFCTVFTYAPRRLHPIFAGSTLLQEHLLPQPFVRADIDREAMVGGPDGAPEPFHHWSRIAGLHVTSFAEYQPATWSNPGTASGTGGAAWRRALALANTRAPWRSGFIMVPWNLAHPASIVPDLIRKLSRGAPLEDAGRWIVLFPFNATPLSASRIDEVVATIRDLAGGRAGVLRSFFLARLTSLQDAYRLRHIFPLAWLEEDDPESAWTRRRLTCLGIPIGLLGPVDDVEASCRFAVAGDEPIRLRVSDNFGEHSFPARSLSVRQLATLLACSDEALASEHRLRRHETAIGG